MGDPSETICALSTAPGRAGIAVVRVSGPGCFRLVERLFRPRHEGESWSAREAKIGSILHSENNAELDQVLLTRFPAPNSYTGEDVAEISLHGSPVLVRALLESLCTAGARLAEPGEFTMRAFLNGRMDLIQAEAVRDIIEASTLYQAQVAARQHTGYLSREIAPLKDRLIDLIVQLEAAVEFVEEPLETEPCERLISVLTGLLLDLQKWMDTYRRGRIVHDGFSLAIVGRPNVGKSSLFNALLSQERSIVTDMPGTTRDLVSESTSIEGVPVRLMDTAGMRRAGDTAERMGVERSMRATADADAILLVVDRSRGPDDEDLDLRRRLADLACIVVMNKADLADAWNTEQKEQYARRLPWLEVSAKTGSGVSGLREYIWTQLFGEGAASRDGLMITNLRQLQCLQAAARFLEQGRDALRQGLSEEFVLVDLKEALSQLGAITGETGVEDLLAEIFSRFCIGK